MERDPLKGDVSQKRSLRPLVKNIIYTELSDSDEKESCHSNTVDHTDTDYASVSTHDSLVADEEENSVDNQLDKQQYATSRGPSTDNAVGNIEENAEPGIHVNMQEEDTDVFYGLDKEVCSLQPTDSPSLLREKKVQQQESKRAGAPCLVARRLFHTMKNYNSSSTARKTKQQEVLFSVMRKCNITSLDSDIPNTFFLELEKEDDCFSEKIVLHLKRYICRQKESKQQENQLNILTANSKYDNLADKHSLDLTKMANSEPVQASYSNTNVNIAPGADTISASHAFTAIAFRKRGRPRKYKPCPTTNKSDNNEHESILSTKKTNICVSTIKMRRTRCGYSKSSLEPTSVQSSRLVNAMAQYKYYSTRPNHTAQFKSKVRVDQEIILYQIMDKYQLTDLDSNIPESFFIDLMAIPRYFSANVVTFMKNRIRKNNQKTNKVYKSYPLIMAKPSMIRPTSDRHRVYPQIARLNHQVNINKHKFTNTNQHINGEIKTDLPQMNVRLTRIDQLLKIGKYSTDKQSKHISIKLGDYFDEPYNPSAGFLKNRRGTTPSLTVDKDKAMLVTRKNECCHTMNHMRRPDIDLTMDNMNTTKTCDSNAETVSDITRHPRAVNFQVNIIQNGPISMISDDIVRSVDIPKDYMEEDEESSDGWHSGNWYLKPASKSAKNENLMGHHVQHSGKNTSTCETVEDSICVEEMAHTNDSNSTENRVGALHKATAASTAVECFRPFMIPIEKSDNVDNTTACEKSDSSDAMCVEDSVTMDMHIAEMYVCKQESFNDSSIDSTVCHGRPPQDVPSSSCIPTEIPIDVHQKMTNKSTIAHNVGQNETANIGDEVCKEITSPDVICVEDYVNRGILSAVPHKDKQSTVDCNAIVTGKIQESPQNVESSSTACVNMALNANVIHKVSCVICGSQLEINMYHYHMVVQHSKWIHDQVVGVSYFAPYGSIFDPKEIIFELPNVRWSVVDKNGVLLSTTVCGIDQVPGFTINKQKMFIRDGKVWYFDKVAQEKLLNKHDYRTFSVECSLCRAVIHQSKLYDHLLKFHSCWIQDKIQEAATASEVKDDLHFKLPEVLVTMLEADGSVVSVSCDIKEVDNVVEKHNISVTEAINEVTADRAAQDIQNELCLAADNSSELTEAMAVDDKNSEDNLNIEDSGTASTTDDTNHCVKGVAVPVFSFEKCYLCHCKVSAGYLWLHIASHHIQWKRMLKSRKSTDRAMSKYFCTHCIANSDSFNSLQELFAHETSVHGVSYSCFICGSSFRTQNDYGHHAAKMHSVLYICKRCPQNFASLQLLQSHTVGTHPEVADTVFMSQMYCKVVCPHCNICFDSKEHPNAVSQMEHHINAEHRRYTNQFTLKSQHQCYSCKQKFSSMAALERHQSAKADTIDTTITSYFLNPNPKFDVQDNSTLNVSVSYSDKIMHHTEQNGPLVLINGLSILKHKDGTIAVTNPTTGITCHISDISLAKLTVRNLHLLNTMTEKINSCRDRRTSAYKQLVTQRRRISQSLPSGLLTRPQPILAPGQVNSNVKQTILASVGQVIGPAQSVSSGSNCAHALGKSTFLPGLGQSTLMSAMRNPTFVPVAGSNQLVVLGTSQAVSNLFQPSSIQNEVSLPVNVSNSLVMPTCLGSFVSSVPVKMTTPTLKLSQGFVNTSSSGSEGQIVSPVVTIIEGTSTNRKTYSDMTITNTHITSTATRGVSVPTHVGIASCVKSGKTSTLTNIPVMSGVMTCTTTSTASMQSGYQLSKPVKNTSIPTSKPVNNTSVPTGSNVSSGDVSKEFREMELKAMQRGYFSDDEINSKKVSQQSVTTTENSDEKRWENLKSAMKIKEEICEMKKSGSASSDAYSSQIQSLLNFVRKELEEHTAIDKRKIAGKKSTNIDSESDITDCKNIDKQDPEKETLVLEPCTLRPCDSKDLYTPTTMSNTNSATTSVDSCATKTGLDADAIQPTANIAIDNLSSNNCPPSQGNTIIINNQQGGSNTIILGNGVTSCAAPTPTVIPVAPSFLGQVPQQVPVPIIMDGNVLAYCQFPSNAMPLALSQPTHMYSASGIQQSISAKTNMGKTFENQVSATDYKTKPDVEKSNEKIVQKASYRDLLQQIVDEKPADTAVSALDETVCVKTKYRNIQPATILNADTVRPAISLTNTQHVPILPKTASISINYITKSTEETPSDASSHKGCFDNETAVQVKPRAWEIGNSNFYKRKQPNWFNKGKKGFTKRGKRRKVADKSWKFPISISSNSTLTKKPKRNGKQPAGIDKVETLVDCKHVIDDVGQNTCERFLRKRKITTYKEPESDSSDTNDVLDSNSESKRALSMSGFKIEHDENADISDSGELSYSEMDEAEMSLLIQDVRSEIVEEFDSVLTDENVMVMPNESSIENSVRKSERPSEQYTCNTNYFNVKSSTHELQSSIHENIASSGTISVKSEPADCCVSSMLVKGLSSDAGQQNCDITSKHNEEDLKELKDMSSSNVNSELNHGDFQVTKRLLQQKILNRIHLIKRRPRRRRIIPAKKAVTKSLPVILPKGGTWVSTLNLTRGLCSIPTPVQPTSTVLDVPTSSVQPTKAVDMLPPSTMHSGTPVVVNVSTPTHHTRVVSMKYSPPVEKIKIKSEPIVTSTVVGTDSGQTIRFTRTEVETPNETAISSASDPFVAVKQNELQQPIILQPPSLASSVTSPLLHSGSGPSSNQQPLLIQQPGNFMQLGQTPIQQLSLLSGTPQNQSMFVQPTQLAVQQQATVTQANQTAQPVFIRHNQVQQACATMTKTTTADPNPTLVNQSPLQPISPAQPMFVQVQQGNSLMPSVQNQPIFIQPSQVQQTNAIQANQASNQLLLLSNLSRQANTTQSEVIQLIPSPKQQMQPVSVKQEATLTQQQPTSKVQVDQLQQSQFFQPTTGQQGSVVQLGQQQPGPSWFVQMMNMADQRKHKEKKNTIKEQTHVCVSNTGSVVSVYNGNKLQVVSPMATGGQQQMFTPGSIVVQQPNILQPTVVAQRPQLVQNIAGGPYVQQQQQRPQMVAVSMPQFNIVNPGQQQLILTSPAGQLQMGNTLTNIPPPQIQPQAPVGKVKISRN